MMFTLSIPVMTLTVSVIKSSMALSLGMVGALSIVRFRTPIKEPEELIFIFCAIAIGLSVRASLYDMAFFGMVFFVIIIVGVGEFRTRSQRRNFYIDFEASDLDGREKAYDFRNLMKENMIKHKMVRYEELEDSVYASFHVSDDFDRVSFLTKALPKSNKYKLVITNPLQ